VSEAEGQLDLLALLPTREEQHPTPPRLTGSPTRGYAAREGAFSEWRQRYGGFDSARVSHGWHAALCEGHRPRDPLSGHCPHRQPGLWAHWPGRVPVRRGPLLPRRVPALPLGRARA